MYWSSTITTKKLTRTLLLAAITAALAVAFVLYQNSDRASAVSASDFDPGRIIDDVVFYNPNAMSASQIQTFLNAKNPHCDTNGSGRATDWGRPDITRATLASYIRSGTNGYTKNTSFHAPPYTCLRNFEQDTPQVGAASGLCEAISAKSNRSAAQIISDVAQACGINPQVLLVLLEKEQSLVTDIWPLNLQYERATGFACPDNVGGVCDSKYNGFFRQVYSAARQFQVYKAYPNSYNYSAGRTNNIFWQTNGGNFVSDGRAASRRDGQCGYSRVYIQNQATAALYIYTPYRPNQAALDNHPGTGDACSAYGNRNFWFMFNNWFGSTKGGVVASEMRIESFPSVDEPTTVSFDITNTSKSTVDIGRIKVDAWGPGDSQYSFPSDTDVSVKPGATYTYKKSLLIPAEGEYRLSVARNYNGNWLSPVFEDYGHKEPIEKTIQLAKSPTITSSLELNKDSVHVNEPITATFSVKNNSLTQSVNVDLLKVEAYDSDGKQYQFGSQDNISINPNSTYKYSSTASFSAAESLTFEIVNRNPFTNWNKTFPQSDGQDVLRKVTVNIKDQVTLTEGLSLDKTTAREGDTVTAAFKVKNFGTNPVNIGLLKVEAIDSKGKYHYFGSTDYNHTLAPGQEYAYSRNLTLAEKGTYNFKIVNKHPSKGWSFNHPASESIDIKRSARITVKEQSSITESLSISPSTIVAGDKVTASFKVKNFGTTSINIGRLKVEAFDDSGRQYQFGSTEGNLTLSPGQEYTYSQSLAVNRKGTYRFRIVNWHPQLGWNYTHPASSGSVSRAQTIVVK